MVHVVGGDRECEWQDKALRRVLANPSRKLGARQDTRESQARTTALTGAVEPAHPRGGFR
jgi:hypothetical protein